MKSFPPSQFLFHLLELSCISDKCQLNARNIKNVTLRPLPGAQWHLWEKKAPFSLINIDCRNEKSLNEDVWGCIARLKWIPSYRNALSRSLFLSGISPAAVSPVDARLAELRHYMQRETDALVLAEDVVKQLEGISSLDQKALAEVGLSINFILK